MKSCCNVMAFRRSGLPLLGLLLLDWLARGRTDGFQQQHDSLAWRKQKSSNGHVKLRLRQSASTEVDLQYSTPKQTGHPALMDAIANFPLELVHDNDSTSVDARRIFHGRGGLYPGASHLTLDYYPPVFLLTSFEELGEDELLSYGDALGGMWASLFNQTSNSPNWDRENITTISLDGNTVTWVYQCRAERGNSTTRLMAGEIPEPHIVTECNGQNKYYVHLLKGQNHGLFLDMSAGRQWLQSKCSDGEVKSILNLFSYTCAFSIAALNGGAESVVNVDMSRGALKTGQRNHELNCITHNESKGSAKFLSHDLFKSWGKIKRLGPYDIVVADPPSYQKGSFVASKDYIKVIRRLPSLLRPKGYALLCLNAPELTTDFLLEQVNEGVPDNELKFVERLRNPIKFASAFPEKALKVLVFQYVPSDHIRD